MAFIRVFLLCLLVAIAHCANWLDNPELVADERSNEDPDSVTWLDKMELEMEGNDDDDIDDDDDDDFDLGDGFDFEEDDDDLDIFDLDEDDFINVGVFSGAESRRNRKNKKEKKDKKDKKDRKEVDEADKLPCENIFEDLFCDPAKPMCEANDDDNKKTKKNKSRLRSYCRKSCQQCSKKQTGKYVARIQRLEMKSIACKDRIESFICEKFEKECFTGPIATQLMLQLKCRSTCGFCA